ncbi:hypothetical protein F4678DRAFT_438737 [Xylaria arbuscula]|nr:hypothetical protein F4678DRAFT_438737 [Xylaria arbuscula]
MKFLTVPALFVASVNAVIGITFGDVPTNLTVGTDFNLTWTAHDATDSDTLQLNVTGYNTTVIRYDPGPLGLKIPIYDTREVVLSEAVKLLDESYIWIVQPVEGDSVWTGDGFLYYFTVHFSNTVQNPENSFQVNY